MNILMVLTSHDRLGDTGKKTGFWLEEFAAPYYLLKDAGHSLTLASPNGGQPPLDPKSDEPDAQTDATRRFKDDAEGQRDLAATVELAQQRAPHPALERREHAPAQRGARARGWPEGQVVPGLVGVVGNVDVVDVGHEMRRPTRS